MRPFPRFAAYAVSFALGTVAVATPQVGTTYCDTFANSTGFPAVIAGSGTAVAAWNQLHVSTTLLPLDSTGYFLCSRVQDDVVNPGGSTGVLCLGPPIGRLVGGQVVNSGSTGLVRVQADLTALPQPGGAAVALPGETWNFQYWYRDVVGGIALSRFSDGLAVLLATEPNLAPGMVPIPAGSFAMGSNAASGLPYNGELFERPVHQVTLSRAFWMGQYEVKQAEYQALFVSNPSPGGGPSHPVENLTWHEARAYGAALTAQQASLGAVPPGYEYRLPTEAEWEYACRAGTTTEFHTGPSIDCADARFGDNLHTGLNCGNHITLPVGSFAPNAFGLYDMHGNAWEWCLDTHFVYGAAAVTDPYVTSGFSRILRGGGAGTNSGNCRSARRIALQPSVTGDNCGFRVVLAPIIVP